MQLAVGVLLVLVGTRVRSFARDPAFFLGVALVVMSLGSFVSELREAHWGSRSWRAPAVLALGITLLAIATGTSPVRTTLLLAVVGLVLVEIGSELLARDFLFTDGGARPLLARRSASALGAVVLAAGVSLLIGAGADPSHAVPLVVALGVVVWFSMADGDALVLVVLVAVVLVWATTPTDAPMSEARAPVANEPYFLVLGDSYISGEGSSVFLEGTNEVIDDDSRGPDDRYTNECRRSPDAWPFLIAEMAAEGKLHLPPRVMFHACSGAVTENIHTLPRRDGKQHGPAELRDFLEDADALVPGERTRKAPEFVLVGIGGNDAGFGTVAETCVGPGNCAEVRDQFLRGVPGGDRRPDQDVEGPPGVGGVEPLSDVDDDFDAAYRRVKNAVLDLKREDGGPVRVIAVSYPNPIALGGRCQGALLHDDERRFVRSFVRQLNRELEAAATRNGLEFMNIEDALSKEGAQLCSGRADQAGLNFVAFNSKDGSIRDNLMPTNWLHNSIHPNEAGHRAIAKAAAAWFECKGKTPDASCNGNPVDVPVEPVASQCDTQSKPSCQVAGRRWLFEQVHHLYGKTLFPLVVTSAGLWLTMAPVMWWRAGRRGADWHLGAALLRTARSGVGRVRAGWRWLVVPQTGDGDPA